MKLSHHLTFAKTSECKCKSLWGEPERVHMISAVNIQDECTVLGCEQSLINHDDCLHTEEKVCQEME